MKVVSSRAGIIQRSRGQSVVATAAYITHERMRDETTGETYSFRQRAKNEVRYNHVYLCPDAPQEFSNPEILWNDVVKNENASSRATTAQMARKFRVCFPQGLTDEQEIELLNRFVEPLTADGMIVHAVIHDKDDGNPHAHLLAAMRRYKNGRWMAKTRKVYDLDSNGNRIPLIDKKTGIQKTDGKGRKQWKCHKEHLTTWDQKDQVRIWRERWAELCNVVLTPEHQITAKSYRDQGLDRLPKKHEGWLVRKIVDAGGISEIREYNDTIDAANKKLDEVKAEFQIAASTIGNSLRLADAAQEERNERLRNLTARYVNVRRTRTDIENDGRNTGGVLSSALGKFHAAVHALRMGTSKLFRLLGLARSSGDRNETDRKELRTALDDAGSRDAAIRTQLDERAALGRPGREKHRDRRGSR